MRGLSAAELLSVWERALPQSPCERALALLESACTDTPRDELAQWSVGRRDTRLLELRERIFGSELAAVADCPACGQRLELTLHVAELLAPSPGSAADAEPAEEDAEPLALHVDDYAIRCRLPNSLDLIAAGQATDDDTGRQLLLERCLLEVRQGDASLPAESLPPPVLEAVINRMSDADPLADIQLVLDCVACGQAWQSTFDVAQYVWQEIHRWAQGTLREVHTLASAYGWHEKDILEMSAWRRQIYLQLVG